MNIVTSECKTTLLLNNAWQPINAVTARTAFAHLLSQNVTALDKNNNLFDFSPQPLTVSTQYETCLN